MLLCSITIFGFLSPLLLKNGFEYLRETLDNNEFQCCDGNCQDKPYVQDLASWVFWKRKEVDVICCRRLRNLKEHFVEV